MKKFKKMLALVLAMAMVVGSMSLSAFAADAPAKGSITINSPVVGATYKVYKVFDMTTNADVDAFSYTINVNNPFYGAVVEYAKTANSGLTLSRIKDSDPAVYNVSVTEDDQDENKNFNAQKFGKAMQKALTDGSPAVTADTDKGIVAKAAVAKDAVDVPTAEKTAVTNPEAQDTSGKLTFTELPLGYFLVNPTYPSATPVTVTMGTGDAAKEFTEADLVKEDGKVKIPRELTEAAKTKINDYATATVTDEYVNKYISDHRITTNKNGDPLNDAGKAEYKADLIKDLKKDAEEKILAAFNNNASEADINVKEPILVFLDSSQPDATINEKNELDKWDIPVNPQPGVQPGQPDHGEPEGGKNIIVQEADPENGTPAYSADWTEAEIGESVHYQLRVNAMNFIRTGATDKDIEQVKEYFLADYQSGHMEFDTDKGLKVSIWQGDNDNNSQAASGTKNVTKNPDGSVNAEGYLDYTAKKDTFFKNTTQQDANPKPTDVFGNDGTGIMIPWVKVVDNPSEQELAALKEQFPTYTITNVPVEGEYETEDFKLDDQDRPIPVKEKNQQGNWVEVPGQYVSVNNRVVNAQNQVLDKDGNPIQKTKPVYTFSLYNSDVTIVVDYWMILKDNAVVDEPGNKNYAQYGWNPIDNKKQDGSPKEPTNPSDTDKPSKKEKVDEATVYTFALAWVKVDEQGSALADAEFELPFYVKKTKDGNAYVYAFKTLVGENNDQYPAGFSTDNCTNKVTTTSTGVITIKGVEQGKYSITETKAPKGYNQLTAPFEVEAKKSGPAVTTKTKTTIYLDAEGNVTDEVTTATVEYKTDTDSYNNDNATGDEEKTVPVYMYKHIVNKQGTELPSTGGIGTTIFYVMGSILVICAGVVLVTRRRMSA